MNDQKQNDIYQPRWITFARSPSWLACHLDRIMCRTWWLRF